MYLNFEPIPSYGVYMPLKGGKGIAEVIAALDGNGSFNLKLESLMKKTPQGIIYFERFENIEIEEIGKKKLAYEIKGEKEGYYILVNFMAKKEDIIEIERFYRINDDVMKFITVMKEN